MTQRISHIKRKTNETEIELNLNLDGSGKSEINTPVNFLNHVLENFSKHSRFDLKINAKGDTHIDDHHTVEDIGICLGEAFDKALGDKRGIARMSHSIVPMDDSRADVSIDLSGRPYAVVDLPFSEFHERRVGDLSKENVVHFLESFALNGKFNLNVKVAGKNDHHKVESCFKAIAKALYDATRIVHGDVPSTKGRI